MPAAHRYVSIADLAPVLPVFPLTGVLLLPRARLPLNIFEPRYLAMIDHSLADTRLIGIVQPREPGEDMAVKPELADVGCVGRLMSFSETDDGRYMITLAGIARFRIARELDAATPYRQVQPDYAPYMDDLKDTDLDLAGERDRLIAALKPYLDDRKMQTDWQSIEDAPGESLVNALAMICPFEPAEKQALLEASDLKARADALIALLEMANAKIPAATVSGKNRIN